MYPQSHWICTKEVLDDSLDPFKNWREEFPNEEALKESQLYRDQPDYKMFVKLVEYFKGNNGKGMPKDITLPITTKVSEKPNSMSEYETCIWAGTTWADDEPPLPLDETVYIQYRPEIEVFAR